MDKHFRDKRLWIGVGGLAIVFLCLAMCGLSAMAMVILRVGPANPPVPYMQPPTEDGGAPPTAFYGYGPFAAGRHSGFSPLGFNAQLFAAGLFALLLLGLLKRTMWGYGRCGPYHWHEHKRGCPPVPPETRNEWRGAHGAGWGPWAPHDRDQPRAPGAGPSAEPSGEHDGASGDGAPYTGPQE